MCKRYPDDPATELVVPVKTTVETTDQKHLKTLYICAKNKRGRKADRKDGAAGGNARMRANLSFPCLPEYFRTHFDNILPVVWSYAL